MLDNKLVSLSSISFTTFEYLNTLSNFCSVFELYVFNAVIISDFKVSLSFVVAAASYFAFVVNRIDVISGSTIWGVTEPTLYSFSLSTMSDFVCVVNVEPLVALIAILTTPYTGVSSSSPPQALTDCALG